MTGLIIGQTNGLYRRYFYQDQEVQAWRILWTQAQLCHSSGLYALQRILSRGTRQVSSPLLGGLERSTA
ncbi:hypothetical protein LCGC14_0909190 [marine sediment metagenome]|uniref:Uncharacterized protein n=1 Tax=marine sediment metagenome TaxID=412755 RepID=A0A0F9RCZ2_9ZZZZ